MTALTCPVFAVDHRWQKNPRVENVARKARLGRKGGRFVVFEFAALQRIPVSWWMLGRGRGVYWVNGLRTKRRLPGVVERRVPVSG